MDGARGGRRDRATIVSVPHDESPPIRNRVDLEHLWRALMGELGFSRRCLWLLFLTPDGRPGPLIPIDDLPDGPYDVPVDDLVALCREILQGPGGGGSVAFLITRPGRDPWHIGDRAWGRYLTAAAQELGGEDVGGRVWPVHRANDAALVPVASVSTSSHGRDIRRSRG